MDDVAREPFLAKSDNDAEKVESYILLDKHETRRRTSEYYESLRRPWYRPFAFHLVVLTLYTFIYLVLIRITAYPHLQIRCEITGESTPSFHIGHIY